MGIITSAAKRYGNVTTPFGDVVSSVMQPMVALKATYGIRSDVQTFTGTGGSVTASNAEYVLQSGTSVGGYGALWSRLPVVYIPGIGCEARFTARMTSPIALSQQLAGFFSAADGVFFGYNGTRFGVMHRYAGEFEIRRLTVGTAATGAETVTVTLNDVAYTATVTAGSKTQNAHEIAEDLTAGAANSLWYIQHIGETVMFTYRGIGAKSGTYSLTSTGTQAGTFAQVTAGATPSEDWTYQESWNKDKADWLDTTKGNLYRIEFAYLGFGPIKFYILHPDLKEWALVHVVNWPGNNTATNFRNPSLRVGWACASLGSSGTNLTVYGASAMAGLHGKYAGPYNGFGAVGNNSSVTTETQVLSLEVRREFEGRICQAVILPNISVATDSTKGMIFRVYLNPTVAGATAHQYIDQTNSCCLYDTDGTTVSGGTLLGAFVVGPSGNRTIRYEDLGIPLGAGDQLVITAAVTSGAASGAFVTINTQEIV